MHNRSVILCVLLTCVLAVGCQLGPKTLEHSRIHYNHAVQTTASEEMLLNLVRMKYRDPVEFVKIPSITGQHTYAGELGFVIPFSGRGGLTAIDLGAEEKPTIVYQPEQGSDFSARILSRIGTETLDLLASKGWAADRTMRLIIRTMNDVDNATSAGGPTPYLKPAFEEFRHATYLIRELQKRRQVELAYEILTLDTPAQVSDPIDPKLVGGEAIIEAAERGFVFQRRDGVFALWTVPKASPVMVFRVAPEARNSPEMLAVAAIFELEPGQEYYRFELNTLGQLKKPSASRSEPFHPHLCGPHGEEIGTPMPSCAICTRLPETGLREEMSVSTRSIMEIMYYLSQGIDVPVCHMEQGLVTFTYDEFGQPFDWRQMTHDLLQVHVSDAPPCEAAAVSVHYRGHYFYIADSDQNSKSTFNLLIEMFNLKVRAGGGAQIPLLTI